jgi:hypothetical protein
MNFLWETNWTWKLRNVSRTCISKGHISLDRRYSDYHMENCFLVIIYEHLDFKWDLCSYVLGWDNDWVTFLVAIHYSNCKLNDSSHISIELQYIP